MNNKAVFCIAKNLAQADQIVQQLNTAGFMDISVLYGHVLERREGPNMPVMTGSESFSGKGVDSRPFAEGSFADSKPSTSTTGGLGHEKNTKAPEGASTGGVVGGLVGGTLGLLAGIGVLAIPGLGPFVAAGPIIAALAGSGLVGGIGLLTGALVGMGIPEYEAVRYAEKIKNDDHILISAHTNNSDEVNLAKEIFERNGAEDISCSQEISVSRSK